MATAGTDIFGRKMVNQLPPITADMVTIVWGGTDVESSILSTATSIGLQYQQQVIRRRTLGSSGGAPTAVIYPTQPQGSMSIARLFAEGTGDIFDYPGWNICKGTADLTISFNGESAYAECATTAKFGSFYLSGATVTGYSMSAEAEGLTIVDGVSVEFLQLSRNSVSA
jgi:hypothetical protein